MKNEIEIKHRLRAVSDRLENLDARIAEEMGKEWWMRDITGLRFLHTERKVYSILLAELIWIVEE